MGKNIEVTLDNYNDDSFAVGLVQHASSSSWQKNCDLAEKLILEAKSKGSQIVCLQEIFASPYFCTEENHKFFDLAENLKGRTFEYFTKVARRESLVLVIPFFEKRAPGVYHNSAMVIDADGKLLGAYRKMHIPDDPLYFEKFYFTPGDAEPGYQVFKTRYAKIGVLICWDQWFPEAARLVSLLGAEILFYPTAIAWHPSEKEEFGAAQKSAWQTVQKAHAINNGVYVAAVNRCGFEETPGTEGLEFFGSSFISSPFGEIVSEASFDKDEVVVAKCSRKKIEETRQHWPFFRDRRIETYSSITKRFDEDE